MIGRLTLTVLDGFGMDVDVELTFRRDVVEVHVDDRSRAVFSRDVVQEWLTYPEGTLSEDDVSLTLSTGGVLLRVPPEVPGYLLSRAALTDLQAFV